MPEVQLSLELAGDSVNLDVIAETTRELHRALRDIERHVTDAEPAVTWRWDDQAVLRAAASPNGVSEGALRQIVHELRTGFQRADEAQGQRVAWPETFGNEAKRAVNKILGHLAELDAITVNVEGTVPLRIEQIVILHAVAVGGPRGYTEITSVDGLLDLISVRGRPSFTIQEHGTGRRIRCTFPDGMLQEVKDALGKRAVVQGAVTTALRPEDITVRPEPPRGQPRPEAVSALTQGVGMLA